MAEVLGAPGLARGPSAMFMGRSHKVDIGGLLSGGRQVLVVDDGIPIESFEGIEFPHEALVHLEVRFRDQLLDIGGTVDVQARGECSRCLEDVVRDVHVDLDERLNLSTDGDADPFGESNVVHGERLDVADLAMQLVYSALPLGLVCKEDCRGLCAVCGSNRNASACSCENGVT